MTDRNCVVLVQHRSESEYNDFLGKFYHFPKKYLNSLKKDNEFIYYEPTKKEGAGAYFGYGKIGKIFEDKKTENHYFAEIIDYQSFEKDVPFHDKKNNVNRETEPFYNPQNAVRTIRKKDLDEICLDGGILLTFKSDAHLIKVLGEQLISSEVVGILELVKNAYDANASLCRVRIEKIQNMLPFNEEEYLYKDLQGPVIIIEDDGVGMDKETIENGWLRPASTLKTQTKDILKIEKEKAVESGKLKTYETIINELKEQHGGRIPLGEKGVGRFATHRLGRHVIIKTKTRNIDYEYILKIDWNKFDYYEKDRLNLEEVGFGLYRQSTSRDYGRRQSGTQIIIYGGREGYTITEETILQINRSLLKLKSPNPEKSPKSFNVIFECPQVTNIETSIEEEFPPVFEVDAIVSQNGIADITLKFKPPHSVPLPPETIEEYDYELRRSEKKGFWIENGSIRTPKCGPFFISLKVWYRSSHWVEGPKMKDFTDYLYRYGGISIFRDGLNIFPAEWGAQIDWLDLSKRHIKKGEKLSYYNMVGNLEIEQSINMELIDKTDRQGLIENAAYQDLKGLVRNIVFFTEIQFIGKRDKFEDLNKGIIREPKELGNITHQGSLLVDNIIKRYDVAKDTFEILSEFGKPNERKENLLNLRDSLKRLKKSIDLMEDVQDILTEQAGFGLAIAVSVHEIAKITSNFYNGVTHLLKSGKVDTKKLEELQDSSKALQSEMKRFGPLRAIKNEKPTHFDVIKSINFTKAVFESKLKKEGIDLRILINSKFNVFARYGALNQILANLLDNSCYWLRNTKPKEKIILIKTYENDRCILIADNGPDINSSIRPYLFKPGYSLKVPPSGLGLYICKYYIQDMGGDIYEAPVKDRTQELHGAQFILDFSRVKEGE